jgi:hypothetical protein
MRRCYTSASATKTVAFVAAVGDSDDDAWSALPGARHRRDDAADERRSSRDRAAQLIFVAEL